MGDEEVKKGKWEESDIVTLVDTKECPEGYEPMKADKDYPEAKTKKGDQIFVPTQKLLKERGRI